MSPLRTPLTAIVALVLTLVSGTTAATSVAPVTESSHGFGPHVIVVDPSMATADIEAMADEIWRSQVDAEMGNARYSILFQPGVYGTAEDPLQIRVGYYTEVAGLGQTPGDVLINGKIEALNRCFAPDGTPTDDPAGASCFALNNFWRTLSNLTITVNGAGQDGCRASANFWAVSQAVSLRRVDVQAGTLSLMDYCSGPSFASGGFLADTRAGVIVNGSQQQWFARNSQVSEWTNAVWNQVFAGVVGAPSDADYPDPPYTTIERTALSRERPYLVMDEAGEYAVQVPAAVRDTSGVTWADGGSTGRRLALSAFLVATPSTPVREINAALADGKHLLLTPGVYDIARTIRVKRANTVILGLGHATLTAVNGVIPLKLDDRPGIVVAGVTIDAGTVESDVLLQVGENPGKPGERRSDPDNPTTLSDVYFRVGGPHVGKVDTALKVNSDNVLIDHTWVWRADHGVEGFTEGVNGDTDRWRTNIGRTGVIVTGDDVTATGLFVEHFQEFNTVWNGERGRVTLYQNELPYDPPTQADWQRPDGTLGWAANKVGAKVKDHELRGGGVYVFNQNNPSIVTTNGYEVPVTPGVRLIHIMTKNLSGPGTISSVVNGVGAAVDGVPDVGDPDNYEDPSYVVSYP